MIGQKLANRYEITAELGRGGMGVVYRARDPLLNRDVAVKLIPPTLLSPDSEQRFQREAQLVAQMDHPAIVPIHDLGSHEGSLFFVMPLVQGTNLRSFLRQDSSLGDVLVSASRLRRRSSTATRVTSCIGTSSPRTSWSRGRRAPASGSG